MLLRLSLIIAIIAGLAAAGLNFFKVKQVMTDVQTERDTEHTAKIQSQNDHAETKKTLAKTEEELGVTKTKLTATETTLKTTAANLAAKEREAADLTTELAGAKTARDEAQQSLEQWRIVGVTPDQVKGMIVDLKKVKEQRDVVIDENKVVTRKLNQVQAKLDNLLGPERAVELPAGLKGRVVAVDPKFDFIVIDVGGDKGVLERGEFLVNRNGKLVGKVRVAAVQPNQSIANVLPEWKHGEIMEGDQVIY